MRVMADARECYMMCKFMTDQQLRSCYAQEGQIPRCRQNCSSERWLGNYTRPNDSSVGQQDVYVDFGAERLLAAEKTGQRIAVEIKSFLGASDTRDLEQAVGQYLLYRAIIERTDPKRQLFLAVPVDAWNDTFLDSLGQLMLESYHLNVIAFDHVTEEVIVWSSNQN